MTRTDRRSFILGLCGTGLVAMSGSESRERLVKSRPMTKASSLWSMSKIVSFREEASPSRTATRSFLSSIASPKDFQTWF